MFMCIDTTIPVHNGFVNIDITTYAVTVTCGVLSIYRLVESMGLSQ